MWSPSAFRTVVKDLALLGVGSFGIVYQQVTGEINVYLLGLYAAMVGAPGGAGLMRLIVRNALIESSSSPPQDQPSPGPPGS